MKKFGDFELIEVLGRGAYGTVWEARHSIVGRRSAVKVLDRLPAAEYRSERFLREAQISGCLRHPHIVKLLEFGHADYDGSDVPFLAYELIEGVTLGEWRQFADLSFREISELFAKIASAVNYAHEHSVVHRDLKPDNILIDLSGEPHITDFGLARRIDDRLTEHNVALGTIAYMSPEQAHGRSRHVAPSADVFSLGAILFEMLTGELPFRSMTIPGYLKELASAEPSFAGDAASSVPRDLRTICLKCLAKDPERRYSSAHALEQDLRRFIQGKPIAARPVSMPERLVRWAARQPVAAALVGVLLCISTISPMIAVQQAQLRNGLQRTARRLRETNYSTDLYLAYQAWNEGRVRQTRQLLDRALPEGDEEDLRCFAWHFLNDRMNESFRIIADTKSPIYDFCLTPDRQNLLTVGSQRSLDYWDFSKGILARSIPLSAKAQFAVAICGDSVLVGDHRDGTAVVDFYDCQSGQRTQSVRLETASSVASIRVSSDRTTIVVGTRYHGVHVLNGDGNEQIFFANHDRNENVVISPDGQFVAASFNRKRKYGVAVWNLREQVLVSQREFPQKIGGLAWRSDSKYLVVHASRELHASLLRVPDLKTAGQIPHERADPLDVDFFDDGRTVVGADRLGFFYTRPILFAGDSYGGLDYAPHEAEVRRLRYVGRGEVLSSSDDGTVVVSRPGEVLRKGTNILMSVGDYAKLAYSRKSDQWFVGDADGAVRNHRGDLLCKFGQSINTMKLIDGDARLACGMADGSIQIIDCENGATVESLSPPEVDSKNRATNTIVQTTEPRQLLTAGADSHFRIWIGHPPEVRFSAKLSDRIPAVVVDEHRGLAFACGPSEYVIAFDLEKQREAYRLPTSKVTALSIDPERSLLFGGRRDSGIAVWDLETRAQIATLRGHTDQVHSLDTSQDGRILASASYDGDIRFWDIGRLAAVGIAYRSAPFTDVQQIAFTRDGKSLLGILARPGRKWQVVRIGGLRVEFGGYEVTPQEFDYPGPTINRLGSDSKSAYAHFRNQSDQSELIGAWVDERCKGLQIRANFHLDLSSGTAIALVDHFFAKDRDGSDQGHWHGISPPATAGKDLCISTDWVRITHGPWHAGPDNENHSYAVALQLSPGAEAKIRSVEIETRPIQ